MQLQPTITFEQFKAAYNAIAALRPKPARTYSWRGYVTMGVICLAFGLALQFQATRVPALSIFAFVILYWAVCKPLTRRSQDKWFRRTYAEEQARLNDQIVTIDESGISCNQRDGSVKLHFTWQAFISRIDTPEAYIFLPSLNYWVRVPKETFTQIDQQQIQEWSSLIPNITSK